MSNYHCDWCETVRDTRCHPNNVVTSDGLIKKRTCLTCNAIITTVERTMSYERNPANDGKIRQDTPSIVSNVQEHAIVCD